MNKLKATLFTSAFLALFGTTTVSMANPMIVNQQAIHTAQTISQAKTLADESYVSLKGQIVRAIGHEKYEFRDTTGTIVVEIDDDVWQGRPVSNQQWVTIQGEIDVNYLPFKKVEIDVDRVIF